MRRFLIAVITLLAAAAFASSAAAATYNGSDASFTSDSTIGVNAVDTAVGQFATFHSNNHRIAYVPSNGDIFIGYDNQYGGTSSEYATANVAMSTNGGSTWTNLLSVKCGTNSSPGNCRPPTMEADKAGNVYAIMGSLTSWPSGSDTNDFRMYMFPKSSSYANNGSNYLVLTDSGAHAVQKYTSAYDPNAGTDGTIFFLARGSTTTTNGDMLKIDPSSSTTASSDTFTITHFFSNTGDTCKGSTPGSTATYPIIYVARDSADSGKIVVAWTEESATDTSVYQDAYFVVSTDDGSTWTGKNGAISSFPILSGCNGPGWLINLSTETSTTDGPWLDSAYMQNGYLQFMYSKFPRSIGGSTTSEYAQFQWDSGSPTATKRITGGTCLSGGSFCPNNGAAGGFLAGAGTGSGSASPIFYAAQVSASASNNRLVTLVSTDDGTTWKDDVESAQTDWERPYGLSGLPQLDNNGQVLGAFTDQNASDSTGTSPNNESARFFTTK